MENVKRLNIGIGFATGRKSFQKVLRTYINNWNESGLVGDKMIGLHLFVAYDLSYHKTKIRDYTNVHPEIAKQLDSSHFIGKGAIEEEIALLIDHNVLSSAETRLIFGKGYAAKRNTVLYYAIKNKMDYLLFLDDDEYPVAVTKTLDTAVWGGQHVLSTHINHLDKADITHGYHCGYISPIPHVQFNSTMTEDVFSKFIGAISNEIVSWEKVKKVMDNGGVTYADPKVLTSRTAIEVLEVNKAKFISGANLGINLRNLTRVYPFYNPPGARGEDTFLSTCLQNRIVKRVPCYTFHDGFSTYNHLLEGVLPIHLKFISADNELIINRFYKACIGWIRYKPLLLYITKPDIYDKEIAEMRSKLTETLPQICAYFKLPAFSGILNELEKYNKNVEKHYLEFKATQCVWEKIMKYLHEREVV